MPSLRDLIYYVDRSESNSQWVDIPELAQELDINVDYVEEEDHQIRAYWLTKWRCTDTIVGLRVYGFQYGQGFEPFAISRQNARKSPEVFSWISIEAAEKVKDYLLKFVDTPSLNILSDDLLDSDMKDGFKVGYSDALLTKSVIEDSTGEFVEVVETFRSIDKMSSLVVKRKNGQLATLTMGDITVPYVLKSEGGTV